MSSISRPSLFAPLDDDEIVRAAWTGLKKYRDGFHVGSCSTSAGRALRALCGGTPLLRECDRCSQLFFDVIVELHGRGRAKLLAADNPAGYARTAAVNAGTEMLRKQRATLGGPSKPDRADGVVGRVRRALDAGWQAQLFDLMLAASTRLQPVSGCGWPLDEFARARAEVTGESSARARGRMAADIDAVLAVARVVAGEEWVYEVVFGGFRGRAAHFGQSLEADSEDGHPSVDAAAEPTSTEQLTLDAVRAAFWRHVHNGTELRLALVAGVADLGTPLPEDGLDAVLVDDLVVRYVGERVVSASVAAKAPVDVAGWLAGLSAVAATADRRLIGRIQRAVDAAMKKQSWNPVVVRHALMPGQDC